MSLINMTVADLHLPMYAISHAQVISSALMAFNSKDANL